MATVPNWIGHAVVILPNGTANTAVPVRSWRPTKTQVVVTLDDAKRTEMRFYLDGLKLVGPGWSRTHLLDANDPATKHRVARIRAAEAVADLEREMALASLSDSRGDHEELAVKVGRIQRAATRALAALADVL